MTTLRITCASLHSSDRSLTGIVEVGGYSWSASRQRVVQLIDSGSHRFYTQDAFGFQAEVVTVHPGYGQAPYLRTTADNRPGNNLLNLGSCPRTAY